MRMTSTTPAFLTPTTTTATISATLYVSICTHLATEFAGMSFLHIGHQISVILHPISHYWQQSQCPPVLMRMMTTSRATESPTPDSEWSALLKSDGDDDHLLQYHWVVKPGGACKFHWYSECIYAVFSYHTIHFWALRWLLWLPVNEQWH